jgi:hypothetical protein
MSNMWKNNVSIETGCLRTIAMRVSAIAMRLSAMVLWN